MPTKPVCFKKLLGAISLLFARLVLEITNAMQFGNLSRAAIMLISLATGAAFTSCQKTEVVVPLACFSADYTIIEVGDTVVFTNCSVADDAVIYFTSETNEEPYVGMVYAFDEAGRYAHAFGQSGTFIATVQASNHQPGSPIALQTETITVN